MQMFIRHGVVFLLLMLVLCGCSTDSKENAVDHQYSWTYIDGNERYTGINAGTIPGGAGDEPLLAAFNDKLYSIWIEDGTAVRVKVFNGNDDAPAWAGVDGGTTGLNKVSGNRVYFPSLTAFNGRLYASWSEAAYLDTGSGFVWRDQVRLAVYGGNDASPAWAFVDGGLDKGINADPFTTAIAPQLTVSGGKLFATWTESGARVAVYNGDDSSPLWTLIDGGGFSLPFNSGGSRLVSFNAKLYLVTHSNGGVSVRVFNNDTAAPVWSSVTGPLPDIRRYTPPPVLYHNTFGAAVYNGKFYLTWWEQLPITDGPYQIQIAVYNGNDSSPDWTFVNGSALYGLNADPSKGAITPQLVVNGQDLYAIWAEGDPFLAGTGISQVRMARYNGKDTAPGWSFVDRGDFGINFDVADDALSPNAVSFHSKVYAIWREDFLGSQVRVAVRR